MRRRDPGKRLVIRVTSLNPRRRATSVTVGTGVSSKAPECALDRVQILFSKALVLRSDRMPDIMEAFIEASLVAQPTVEHSC